MGSPNRNTGKYGNARPMPRNEVCSICGKKYAMNWAKRNHEKLCKERFK